MEWRWLLWGRGLDCSGINCWRQEGGWLVLVCPRLRPWNALMCGFSGYFTKCLFLNPCGNMTNASSSNLGRGRLFREPIAAKISTRMVALHTYLDMSELELRGLPHKCNFISWREYKAEFFFPFIIFDVKAKLGLWRGTQQLSSSLVFLLRKPTNGAYVFLQVCI